MSHSAWTTRLWARTQGLFDAVVDLSPAERDAYLDAHCTDSPDLREAVLRLLQAHQNLGDDTAAVPGAEVVDSALRAWSIGERLAAGADVGEFRVVREIGVGGMGVVYLAERAIEDRVQRVAVKLAQSRALGGAVVDRLRRERGILAGLEHPHIARLIDAGELADGTPYFAMEYVEGVAITRYADEHGLDIAARLHLLLQVVDAVQHAHLSLIVHRDIKSANVLVRAGGTATLLDFGIAKPLANAGDTALTGDAERFFSPMAAAPEQVRGESGGIGTDVYALGVLAYELLGGTAPFDFTGLRSGEIEQRILEVVPPVPSRSLEALAQRDPAAAERVATARAQPSVAALRQRLRDDLDAIVARALRKLPRERYPSAEALGRDLRAVLDNRPIEQRTSERAYRLRKFIRRHRVPVALASLAFALLVAFVATTLVQSARIAAERDLAQARRQQAEEQRNRAEQVSRFLVGLFRASDPENARGREVTARELLDRGATDLDRELKEQPKIRAALMATIGDIYLTLSDLEHAQRFVEQAATLRESLPADAAELADSRRQQAELALALGKHADALARADEALAATATDSDRAWDKLQPLRAQALKAGGKIDEAIVLMRAIRERQLRVHGPDAPRTRGASLQLAYALKAKGAVREALDLLRDAFREEAPLAEPDDPDAANLLHHRALLAIDLEDYAAAERDARRAAATYTKVFGEGHSTTAGIYNTLGIIAAGQHDLPRAVAEFEHALAIKTKVYGTQHPKIAMAEYNIGTLLHMNMGDAKAGEPHLRTAAAIAMAVLPEGHRNRAEFRLAWGRALRDLGQPQLAEREIRAALAVFEANPSPRGIDIASAKGELACLQLAEGKNAAATESLAAALAELEKYLAADDPKRIRMSACKSHD